MPTLSPLLLPSLPSASPSPSLSSSRRRRETAPMLRLVPANRPNIELVYGATRLMAVMVSGRLSVETTLKLLKLIPCSRHDKARAKQWGLDVLFYDPHWAVPEQKPDGQRVAFL